MTKPKIDFKDLLLRKGEWIALGVAAFGLVILLLMGVSTGAGAANPADITKKFSDKSQRIMSGINNQNESATVDALPEAVRTGKSNPYRDIRPDEFATNTVLFDLTGRPDTKRENPKVLGIEDYQVDLVRGAMPGYDIIYVDGKDPQIAVRVEKKLSTADKEKLKAALEKISKKGTRGAQARSSLQSAPPPAAPGGPPGVPGPGGPPGVPGAPGAPPGAGGGFGFGGPAGGYSASEKRDDVAISYIPLDELDKAMGDNKLPAQTVIPLRMILVNFTIPLKKQMEEMKRALRLQTLEQAKGIVVFDGFEVRRKITQRRASGEVVTIQDWAKYDYESKYVDLIFSRKLRDHVEGGDTTKESKYLPYFYRYEDSLVMPLPELVSELGSYPPIRLKPILDTVDKLIAASAPKIDPSKTLERLRGGKGSRKDLFNPNGGADAGADVFNPGAAGGNGPLAPPKKDGNAPGAGSLDNQSTVEIEHLLGRFVDCDVQPGLSYEYQIQLRMVNPNYGASNLPFVSNPNDTKKQILTGPWVPLAGSLTVPTEDFLFASDRNQYVADILAAYKDQANLKKALDAKDNQAVVQAVKWMESIRMEGKHEPIGGWVVAEMPVSRGEYIGKKTFVKLPLWSSERNEYVFREIAAGAVKGKDQPKGWLVDFSSKSILVDFEGGKVTPKVGTRNLPTEEAASELLIVRADGKLIVRRSTDDVADPARQELTGMWNNWLRKVETRPTTAVGTGENNPFDRPKN